VSGRVSEDRGAAAWEADTSGVVIGSFVFNLTCGDQVVPVFVQGAVVVTRRWQRSSRNGAMRPGDLVTVYGLSTELDAVDDGLYREPGRRQGLEAIRIVHGRPPRKRRIDVAIALTAASCLAILQMVEATPAKDTSPGGSLAHRSRSREDPAPPVTARTITAHRIGYTFAGRPPPSFLEPFPALLKFAAKEAVRCPTPTVAASSLSPAGLVRWCQDRNGRRHGPWIQWSLEGRKKGQGTYHRGERRGQWVSWHRSEHEAAAGTYHDGRKHGTWTRWDYRGIKIAEGTYCNGVKHGHWCELMGNRAEGTYLDGVKHGRWQEDRVHKPLSARYPKAQMAVVHYDLGTRHGPYVAYFDRSHKAVEGTYEHGRRHGRWVAWDECGQKTSYGEYRHGRRHGRWTEWHGCGELDEPQRHYKASVGSYRAGEKQGFWATWHENGRRASTGRFRQGRRQGSWTQWSYEGRVLGRGEYRDGNRHGPWYEWHDYSAVGRYWHGRRLGRWRFRSATGRYSIVGNYRDGLPHGRWRLRHRDWAITTEYADGKVVRGRDDLVGLEDHLLENHLSEPDGC